MGRVVLLCSLVYRVGPKDASPENFAEQEDWFNNLRERRSDYFHFFLESWGSQTMHIRDHTYRTYAASLLYSYTPQYAQDELERHQSQCLNIIFLTITPYTAQLPLSKVNTLKDVFQKLCVRGVENDL